MPTARSTLPPEAASVRSARHFVRTTLRAWGLHATSEVAEFLVSELATNAVLHARSEFTVEVEHDGDGVRILVSDASRAVPRQRAYGPESTTGRGIRLVDALAERWGVERAEAGKTVWFVVPAEGDAGLVPVLPDLEAGLEADVDVDATLAGFPDLDGDAPAGARLLLAAAA